MKVGDYVRTDDGFISKYIGKNKNKWCMNGHLSFESTIRDIRFEDLNEDNIIWESEIEQGFVKIKSSPNIIDLIEEGDYVNGWKVIEHAHEPGRLFVPYVYIGGKGFTTYEDYSWELKKENEDNIHTIVTKEQYEEMEYKIDD